MKIKIKLDDGNVKEIDADPVEFKGFERWKFAVHRTDGDDTFWNVTELSTGLKVGLAGTCRNCAIDAARKRLEEKGIEMVEKTAAALAL